VLPDLPKDAGDRNRTSPFAFVGNRFEFRSVGSNQSIAGPLTAINTIVAESLGYCADRLEAANAQNKEEFNKAVQALIRDIYREHQTIVFNGDGYSKEWHQEAEHRGIPNRRSTPDSLHALVDPDVLDLFESLDVLSKRELRSRYEIYMEQYIKQVNVEVKTTLKIAKTLILPAAMKNTEAAANAAASLVHFNIDAHQSGWNLPGRRLAETTSALMQAIDELETALTNHPIDDMVEEMNYYRDTLLPSMNQVRYYADALELQMDDALWPLPTFHEMLFMK